MESLYLSVLRGRACEDLLTVVLSRSVSPQALAVIQAHKSRVLYVVSLVPPVSVLSGVLSPAAAAAVVVQ